MDTSSLMEKVLPQSGQNLKYGNIKLNEFINIILIGFKDIHRHASGNNIYTSTFTLIKKILVIRYACCDCGYVGN